MSLRHSGSAWRARFRRCTASCRCGVSSARDDQRESAAETRHRRHNLQAGRPPERGRLHRDHRLLQLLSFLIAGSFAVIEHLTNVVGHYPLLSVVSLAAVRKLRLGSPLSPRTFYILQANISAWTEAVQSVPQFSHCRFNRIGKSRLGIWRALA